MTHDPLDDQLDHSAPSGRPASTSDLEAMIAEARTHSRPRRDARLLIGAGAVAALLVTGVGTAAATDGFSWAPWAQDPLGAIPFTMANGFDCEIRFSEYTGGADPSFVGEVNGVLRDWYLEADVLGQVEPLVPAARADPALASVEELQPGETVEGLPAGESEQRAWVHEWMAWDLAISEAEWESSSGTGSSPATSGWRGANGAVKSSASTRITGRTRPGPVLDARGGTYRAGAPGLRC